MVEARFARLCEKSGAMREGEAPVEPTNSMRARKTNVLGLGGSLALPAGLQRSLAQGISNSNFEFQIQ